MSKKRFRPCICLILQQSCCLCSKSCCWIIRSCRYFSKVVSELSVFLTSWILARGDPFLKAHFQFGAEPWLRAGEGISLTRRSRVGWEYPQVERNRETPRGGGGWFRENTVIISGGGFSWEFSRPLITHGEYGRKRKRRVVEPPAVNTIFFRTWLLIRYRDDKSSLHGIYRFPLSVPPSARLCPSFLSRGHL